MMRSVATTLFGFALFATIVSWTPVHADPSTSAAARLTAQAGAPQAPGADPWGFDQQATESWSDVLRPQALDLALLTGLIALALVGFFRKSLMLKYVTLAATVGYMGFIKSELISVVDLFGILEWKLPIFKYNLAWYLFVGFTALSAVLLGRLYCGRICAFGALTQLLDAILPARLRVDVPSRIERRAAWVKYGVLAVTLAYFFVTRDRFVYRFVEPFWMFGLFGSPVMWVALACLLLATVFIRNLYCRFLCPVGATLGLLSKLTVFRIKRWSECDSCKICEKACAWGAIRGPKIVPTECVRCDDCERLYSNERKCPHWIVLRRQRDKAAAQA